MHYLLKMNRGALAIFSAVKILQLQGRQVTSEFLTRAVVIGWSIELMQSYLHYTTRMVLIHSLRTNNDFEVQRHTFIYFHPKNGVYQWLLHPTLHVCLRHLSSNLIG